MKNLLFIFFVSNLFALNIFSSDKVQWKQLNNGEFIDKGEGVRIINIIKSLYYNSTLDDFGMDEKEYDQQRANMKALYLLFRLCCIKNYRDNLSTDDNMSLKILIEAGLINNDLEIESNVKNIAKSLVCKFTLDRVEIVKSPFKHDNLTWWKTIRGVLGI